jgi:hypothetical protein
MAKPHTEVPTLNANRFLVQSGERLRLAFGEQHDGEDSFHQAVSLSREDALELAGLITKLLAPPTAGA